MVTDRWPGVGRRGQCLTYINAAILGTAILIIHHLFLHAKHPPQKSPKRIWLERLPWRRQGRLQRVGRPSSGRIRRYFEGQPRRPPHNHSGVFGGAQLDGRPEPSEWILRQPLLLAQAWRRPPEGHSISQAAPIAQNLQLCSGPWAFATPLPQEV